MKKLCIYQFIRHFLWNFGDLGCHGNPWSVQQVRLYIDSIGI